MTKGVFFCHDPLFVDFFDSFYETVRESGDRAGNKVSGSEEGGSHRREIKYESNKKTCFYRKNQRERVQGKLVFPAGKGFGENLVCPKGFLATRRFFDGGD